MAANTLNRQTVVDALAALLTTYCVGTGKAQEVVGYMTRYIQGRTPLIVAIASGSDPLLGDTQGDEALFQQVDLMVYIILPHIEYDRDGETVVFSEAESEQRLNLLHKLVMDCIVDNPGLSGTVHEVKPNGPSQQDTRQIDGVDYRIEAIPLRADKAHG